MSSKPVPILQPGATFNVGDTGFYNTEGLLVQWKYPKTTECKHDGIIVKSAKEARTLAGILKAWADMTEGRWSMHIERGHNAARR